MGHALSASRPGRRRPPELSLTDAQFAELQSARLVLVAGGAIEEKFEILLTNCLDLEKTVLSLSADQMVRGEITYPRMFETRLALNRALINLLTTTRLYLDHLPHHANEIVGKARQPEVTSLMSKEHDADFRYRFIEVLRNYVQHRGFPAHGLSLPGRRVEHVRRDFVFSLEFSALRKCLADDNRFKKTVLDETPETVDLKDCCRYYVECISAIHQKVREIATPVLDPARSLVEQTIADYQKAWGRKPLGLAALRQETLGRTELAVPWLLDWDDIRVSLLKRNRELVNLRDRCITSAIQPPK